MHQSDQKLHVSRAYSDQACKREQAARERHIAVAVQWYAQSEVSQDKAVEIAELSQTAFLEELNRRRVPAPQITADELADEAKGASADA